MIMASLHNRHMNDLSALDQNLGTTGGACIHSGQASASDVSVLALFDDRVSCDEFSDTALDIPLQPKPGRQDPVVGNEVVAFVRVLSDGSFEKHKARKNLLDNLTKLHFGQVGIVQADVVRFVFHRPEVLDRMKKDPGYIADMNVVALEMPLKNDDSSIMDSSIDEIVHEEIH